MTKSWDGSGNRREMPLSLLTLILGWVLVSSPASAAPRKINNCRSITASGSYSVTANLSAAGDCLIIEANLVKLDLNGHTLTGDGTGRGIWDGGVGRGGIEVRNGSVTNFEHAIYLPFSDLGVVSNMFVWLNSGAGIRVGRRFLVTGNQLGQNAGGGILFTSSVVRDNQVFTIGSDGLVSEGGVSTIIGNTVNVIDGVGITSRTGSVVRENTVLVSGEAAIAVIQGVVADNTAINVSPNGFGIHAECPSTVRGNMADAQQGTPIVTIGPGCTVVDNSTTP